MSDEFNNGNGPQDGGNSNNGPQQGNFNNGPQQGNFNNGPQQGNFNNGPQQGYGGNYNPQDVPSTLINLVSCCFPIVGLILFIVWKDSKPISSKAVGKWALIGFIIGVVGYVLSMVLGIGSMMMLDSMYY